MTAPSEIPQNRRRGGAPREGPADLILRRRTLEAESGASPPFAGRLRSLRHWQAARLAATYQDFRKDPRFAAATEFFLTDLYGPEDFPARHRELERVWGRLRRALPRVLVGVLQNAIELDVLTLELDHAMVKVLRDRPLDAADMPPPIGK